MFRAVIIGLLIGAALFFAPFGFPFFIFPVIFFILLFRFLIFRRRAYWGCGPWGYGPYHDDYDRTMPIDGYHDSGSYRRGGEERNYSVH